MRLTDQDRAAVAAAVTAAEAGTDGEIVTIVARQSDKYHDVALQWGVIVMLLVLALLAVFPGVAKGLHLRLVDGWAETVPGSAYYTIALVLMAATFLICRLAFAPLAVRMALTPGATKTRRVRAKALQLFRTGAEKRTVAATGVLLYLSLAEHRAELIADEAIHGRVPDDVWGHAMASLIAAVKDGRPGDGMAAAVREIGVVLAEHFPISDGDVNELPDRLIEL
ncbi:TPM domain-containing protein [uncultured Sphingomonas sp.]|uniref:TPM domain-containing protein n=1 Tax=uncultured Sphingomonas sp. TaxID=158754 RepID=UPI003747A899